MSDWLPIHTAPKDGTPVLVYFAKYRWRDMDGATVLLDKVRDHVERCAPGWYDNGWFESGTAHDMFESWRDESQFPTHWMPLPEPPDVTP
jgi:hypothetical protein